MLKLRKLRSTVLRDIVASATEGEKPVGLGQLVKSQLPAALKSAFTITGNEVRLGGSTGAASTDTAASPISAVESGQGVSSIGAPSASVPVSELAALAASGTPLNRKQRRALQRLEGKL